MKENKAKKAVKYSEEVPSFRPEINKEKTEKLTTKAKARYELGLTKMKKALPEGNCGAPGSYRSPKRKLEEGLRKTLESLPLN